MDWEEVDARVEQERALNQSTALSPASRWTQHFTVFHTKPHFTLCQYHTTFHSVHCSTLLDSSDKTDVDASVFLQSSSIV